MKGISLIFTVIVISIVIMSLGIVLLGSIQEPTKIRPALQEGGKYVVMLTKCKNAAKTHCHPADSVETTTMKIVGEGGTQLTGCLDASNTKVPCTCENFGEGGKYFLCSTESFSDTPGSSPTKPAENVRVPSLS